MEIHWDIQGVKLQEIFHFNKISVWEVEAMNFVLFVIILAVVSTTSGFGGHLVIHKADVNHFFLVGGGHYIAYGKTDAGWFEYNDSHVSKISESQLVSPNAYLLFYTAK